MKQFFLLIFSLLAFWQSYTQIDSIGFEMVYEHPDEVIEDSFDEDLNLFGYKTWVLYAYVQNSDDFLSSYYGDINNPAYVSFSEGSTVYQHSIIQHDTGPLNDALFEFIPAYQFDSYLTLGTLLDSDFEDPPLVANVQDNNVTPWQESFNQSGDIIWNSEVGAAVFTTLGNPNGVAGDDLKVPLGQFTTDGSITAQFCLQVFINGNQLNEDVNCSLAAEAVNEYGCMDTEACNYSPNVLFDNGTCTYSGDACNDYILNTIDDTYDENCECTGLLGGCTDLEACNYNSEAEADDGSCGYPYDLCGNFNNGTYDDECECAYSIQGAIFRDDNYNGILDEGELPLPYQLVTIQPLGYTIITNDSGQFFFADLEEGSYTLDAEYSDIWTNFTTSTSQSIVLPTPGSSLLNFGVTNEDPPPYSACVDFYQSGVGVPCNDVLNFNICYRNMSVVPISGIIEVQFDELMSYNNSYPQADSIVGQSVFWSYDNLNPMSMFFDDVILNTPDETHIGEWMTQQVTLYAWEDGNLIPLVVETIDQEVTCAYDPNDITGIPGGYTDAHLVLPDTRMEYVIRFQNTGNAPAGTVRIVDTLDVDMDWSSFELIANSHSVQTIIEPESGQVEFLFENINLPDSIENEPESHGLVSFKIDFNEGIEIGEEVNQTAYIYFDNNPPVITNTTLHTVHECGGEAEFELSSLSICADEEITFTSTYPLVEDYQWNLDAAPVSNDSTYSTVFSEADDYIVQLVSTNPICSDATSQMITVYDNPTAEITENGALLTASSAFSYQWMLDTEPIDGATEQTYEATEDGSYTVEVTNENSCSSISGAVMIVGVSNLSLENIKLYPNPMSNIATLSTETSKPKTITLIDSQGKTVRTWENLTEQSIEIKRGELASGAYSVNVKTGDATYSIKLLIQ